MAFTADVLMLMHGNNFFASAARLRGLGKDVYQLLYAALVKKDVKNSWRQKLPFIVEGEGKEGC